MSTAGDETKKDGLRSRIKSIVRTVETEAVALVGKLEEAERQAEIRRQEWLVQQERRRREEDRQRVEKSIEESRAKLGQVIERWSRATSVERFFAGVEERAAGLSGDDQEAVMERLGMAREFLGTQDPLDSSDRRRRLKNCIGRPIPMMTFMTMDEIRSALHWRPDSRLMARCLFPAPTKMLRLSRSVNGYS